MIQATAMLSMRWDKHIYKPIPIRDPTGCDLPRLMWVLFQSTPATFKILLHASNWIVRLWWFPAGSCPPACLSYCYKNIATADSGTALAKSNKPCDIHSMLQLCLSLYFLPCWLSFCAGINAYICVYKLTINYHTHMRIGFKIRV